MTYLLVAPNGLAALQIVPKTWQYKNHPVGYEVINPIEGMDNGSDNRGPILLLNGFGVGSFHQHRLMPMLARDTNSIVYGIDYLGQGRSWPKDCDDGMGENERGLIYSADTWLEQIINFIDNVIIPANQIDNASKKLKVHVVGNSVGGYLSVALGNHRPDLVETISLLNATPIWGLNLPGWDGKLPAPPLPKFVGRLLFDQIRDLNTIEKYLEVAYANADAFDEDLMAKIRACTEGKGGHAAFASIMWSPPVHFKNQVEGFSDALSHLRCDTLLLFGAEDKWCTPSIGKNMMKSLNCKGRNEYFTQRYIELSDVGHCPNHEAPKAVSDVLSKWISSTEPRRKKTLQLLPDEEHIMTEPWGDISLREVDDEDILSMNVVDTFLAQYISK
eukprot:CAMPEP_0113321998 /NCGR_PEP_ID=MMETSP0010_2-20120614/15297_1 /TAXON_ID=216773 ORGANISM="Corethron hystrix, Strain 308" /NCGR_SAMPLE_ID=MMETSP0010_2 /ASSEMBLY_ACC=CAM_ASM_000155 /LENGTH=387 /DNA_ID=CAMNT_0000180321 /DNA_START=181 /DNA_END=1344 /DNA_ORIENTATION=+ /assembly_acc=CAM_ASM_000155